jgi:hypothetical protein
MSGFTKFQEIPGYGKTVLSTIVLKDVRQLSANDPGKATAYFYFDLSNSRKHNTEMMVQSLVSQLPPQCIEILPRNDALSSARKHGQSPPPTESLLEVL